MKKRNILTSTILTVTILMVAICSGCAQSTDKNTSNSTTPLQATTKQTTPVSVTTKPDGTESAHITDFAVRLFQENLNGDNVLISPLSVISALGMTANGAKAETLAQMEQTFGISTPQLNTFLSTYMNKLPDNGTNKLSIANSIWFKKIESFTVEQDFLETNEAFYHARLYQTPFDSTTLQEINNWVSEETDGMITDILDKISEEAVMYLINALAFDAKWDEIYSAHQVREGIFTKEDGTTQNIELMRSTEQVYLEDEYATGFFKYYKNKEYAFVALLPKEGVTVSDYVSSLTGEHLNQLLSTPQDIKVHAAIPKFEAEYSVEMSEILQAMGIRNAFDYAIADFSGIGSSTEGNLVINRVIHKTFISVDEMGTEAGAATVVEINVESAMMEPEETKTVYLDRPFVYMLIDCEENLPLFMGTVMSVE